MFLVTADYLLDWPTTIACLFLRNLLSTWTDITELIKLKMGLECTWTDYRTEFCTSCRSPGGNDSVQEPVLSWHCKPRGVRTSVTSPRCARCFTLRILLYGFFHVCDTVIGRLGWTGVNISVECTCIPYICMLVTCFFFLFFSTCYTSSLLLLSVTSYCHLSSFCIYTSFVTHFLSILLACHSCMTYNLPPMAVFLFDLSLKGIT